MSTINKIIVFGCPRSGTTYLEKWLQNTLCCEVVKLPEYDPKHPINSKTGLIKLCRDKGVLLVYISRSDNGIFNSFRAAKYASQNGLREKITSPMPNVQGIASNSNTHIWAMIEATKRNTHAQVERVRMISIMYEMLDFEDTAWRLEENLEKAGIELKPDGITPWHFEHWKKKPVRGGALSYGIKVSDYGD